MGSSLMLAREDQGLAKRSRRRPGAILPGLVLAAAFALLTAVPAAARGPDSLADLAASVSDAVVNISATQAMEEKHASAEAPAHPQEGTPFDDLFDEFFKKRQQQGGSDAPHQHERRSNSLGSGFVIDPSGIIITNNHVIADANEVTVIFTNGQKLRAEVVGKDAKIDVAVLRVKPEKPLKSVKFGDSEKMRVGDWVMAVGNPFGLGGTVTAGIVSARNRNIESGPYDDFIQTDAAINKGNSGGPLFNMDGDVIGINTAILSPSGGSIGIGFATPSDAVLPIIEQLEKFGETRRGWLGVRIRNVDDSVAQSLDLGNVRGAIVMGLDAKSPASAAGLETGDVIVKFDGKPVTESRDLQKIVAQAAVGKDVEIVVMRHGHEVTTSVRLGLLENTEKHAALEPEKAEAPAAPVEPPAQMALGMTFSGLTSAARQKYAIANSVASGVVITGVAPSSAAASKKLQPGEVVVEINQEPVKQPEDAAQKIDALKAEGKTSALLLIANAQGEVRFVAVPVN
ncbi:MAG: Do family serine endopeptidase [Beijerinckiaceae bacterium]|jgi:serine protease Do